MKASLRIRLIAVHCLFWFLVMIMDLVGMLDCEELILSEFLIEYIGFIALFYLNYFVLIPGFISRKKYLQYFLVSEFIIIATILSIDFSGLIDMGLELDEPWYAYPIFLIIAQIPVVLYFIVSFFARYYIDWYQLNVQQKKLEIDRLNSQLRYLKMQVQPHFLFNSLNNLYALCIEKDDAAPEMVSKLSRLMRYMLYETEAKQVPLLRELEMMEDFVDLQLLKKPISENIDFYTEGVAAHHMIPPLLLLNFMENAFKHSEVFSDPEAFVRMSCSVTEDELSFEATNSIGKARKTEEISGIGNVNVKQQLDILYGENYQLYMNTSDELYHMKLCIPLRANFQKQKSDV